MNSTGTPIDSNAGRLVRAFLMGGIDAYFGGLAKTPFAAATDREETPYPRPQMWVSEVVFRELPAGWRQRAITHAQLTKV
jgi:hypothetical protein